MIERYTRKEMGEVWSSENKYRKWLDVELAVCEAWGDVGEIPIDVIKGIKHIFQSFDSGVYQRFEKRINEIEIEVKHDVIAFLTALSHVNYCGENSKYIHKGMTSADLTDTAQALLMKDAGQILIKDLDKLLDVLKYKAVKYKDLVCIGRSHGMFAEPMTFGLKFLSFYSEMRRNTSRLLIAIDDFSYGKLSGPVGTYSNISPEIEELALTKLGLDVEPVATQVIPRDRYANFLFVLALIASSIERISIEIRHLQRSEVAEVAEGFSKGQKGSSAMPHKRNPIGTENLSGLARIVKANSQISLDNIALWHERDISHSSVERVILPDSTILVDYMLNRLRRILEDLDVYEGNITANLDKSYRLYFSQKVLLKLIDKGLNREDAYDLVQRAALSSWNNKIDFEDTLIKDTTILDYLSPYDLHDLFDINDYLGNIDTIFDRVLS